jgi:poly-gamma-glutamate capsule biosynthesis protein CapA/YwtB (metallophosphatase superfamily)
MHIKISPTIRRINCPLIKIACCLFAWWACAATSQAPAADSPEPTVKIVMVGDVMLADLPGKAIAEGKDPFAPFESIFHAADLTIGNLECVVATVGEPIPDKPWTFRTDPRCIPLLKKHFDALCLANNHTGDFGKKAFAEQLDLLKGKVPVFGGGSDIQQARKPLVLERHGIRVALLGRNEYQPREFEAGADKPGVAWLEEDKLLADVASARKEGKADLVIPFLHWGDEGEPEPTDDQRSLARKLIDAGADAVVGGHPHCTQGVEYYKDHLIVYSLGNFVFDGFEEDGTGRIGWVLKMTFSKTKLLEWDTVAAKIDDDGLPHIEPNAPTPYGKAGSTKISTHTGK